MLVQRAPLLTRLVAPWPAATPTDLMLRACYLILRACACARKLGALGAPQVDREGFRGGRRGGQRLRGDLEHGEHGQAEVAEPILVLLLPTFVSHVKASNMRRQTCALHA